MREWSEARRHVERYRMKKIRRSRLPLDWMNSRLKNGIFRRPFSIDYSTTSNLLEVVNRVYTISTLILPHYMVLASIWTSPKSKWITTVILDSGSEYNFIYCSALFLS